MTRIEPAAVLLLLLVFLAAKKGLAMPPPTTPPTGPRPRMSIEELRSLARLTGFPDPDTAAAVAMAESGGDPGAVGDVNLGFSYGLWQINLRAHPEFVADRLLEAGYNAQAALLVSSGGTSWTPWTTYRNGAYKKYMPPAAAPSS